MELTQINYLAVFVAALSSFVVGFLWYSPFLFAKAWMREAGYQAVTYIIAGGIIGVWQ